MTHWILDKKIPFTHLLKSDIDCVHICASNDGSEFFLIHLYSCYTACRFKDSLIGSYRDSVWNYDHPCLPAEYVARKFAFLADNSMVESIITDIVKNPFWSKFVNDVENSWMIHNVMYK